MIPVPTRKLLILLAAPLGLLLAGILSPIFLILGITGDIILLVICLYDYAQAVSPDKIKVELIPVRIFSIGRKNLFSLRVINTGNRHLDLEFALDIPPFWEDITMHNTLALEPAASGRYQFELLPRRRGVHTIRNIHFRYQSGAGLFTLNAKRPVECEIEVYPDIKELNQYLALSRKNRLAQIGIHRNRYQGMGSELEYLREYQQDDDAGNIEWKVTTRVHKPVTKVFQLESSNQVIIALDCGRLMTGEQEGMNTLDYAVNAILILGHIIIRMGDQLGIIAYADRILAELAPSKGKDAVKRLSHFVADLKPGFTESNHKLIFEYLHKRLKKRSLVIFFSDMIDDINYALFRKYLSSLNSKHQTLFILLRDVLLEQHATGNPVTLQEVCATAAAREMFLKRNEAISKLRLNKINVLDLLPDDLTPRLIDKYLEIKSRNLL